MRGAASNRRPYRDEFVAIILLGRVRLGSNRHAENTRDFASAVGDVLPAKGVRLGSNRSLEFLAAFLAGLKAHAPNQLRSVKMFETRLFRSISIVTLGVLCMLQALSLIHI